MRKKSVFLKIKINEETARKLACISKAEGMSIQNEINAMLRQKIQYFERTRGKIPNIAQQSVDMCEFIIEESDK